MPPSSPAHAPVRSIALGSNVIGVAVLIAATTWLGLALAVGAVAADCAGLVAEADPAGRVVPADGTDVDEPQPTRTVRPAHSSPRNRRLPRGLSVLTTAAPS